MMHIGFLTSEFPHEKVAFAAGIGTSINNLVTALRNEDISVSVFVYDQQTDDVFIENGIKIHLIKHRKYGFLGWYRHRKFLEQYINHYIHEDQIDVIEAPDWTGITAFMNLSAPLVIRFHGSDTYFCKLENRRQKTKNFIFEKLGLTKAVAYIAPTDFAGKLSKTIFKIEKPVQTIHYGLSLEKFQNPNPQQFTKGVILYIGTIIRKKGVLELPGIFEHVLKRFPEAQLILIGGDSFDLKTGSASTWALVQQIASEKVRERMKYLGKVPYQEVQQHIRNANVCVFPTFAETLGMVTIESMAMQKPVVNSSIGWAPELIDDGINGFLVHPTQHDLYAQRIIDVLQDDQLYLKIGAAARKKVEEKFDIRKEVHENIAFYSAITNKNKR